jgi:hypothetical protein
VNRHYSAPIKASQKSPALMKIKRKALP